MRPAEMRTRVGRQQGIVLVLVLWLLALLAIMAGSYSLTTRTETRLTAAQVQAAQARGLAEAGIWLGVQQLLQPGNAAGSNAPGFTSLPFGPGVIDVHIQDEAGKIDLNTARPEVILGLLLSSGADTVQAAALSDAILDWRDRDNLRRVSGAEDNEYVAKGMAGGAKDGPFNSVEELRGVLGMTEALFKKMRPVLTLYSHQPGIAGDVAVPEAAAAVREGRFLSGRRSQIYAITSTGKVADTALGIEAVVQLRSGGKPPYAILSWREAPWRNVKSAADPAEADRG